MSTAQEPVSKVTQSWTARQAYSLSAICIVVGLVFGYFLRGTAGTTNPSAAVQPAMTGAPESGSMAQKQKMPSLDDMKRMADKKAEPLLAQLKNDPKNPKVLVQIGNVYKSAHQFDAAANYFSQALALTPKDIAIRDEVGAAKYYAGDVDGAIAIFEEGLKYSPNDVSSLFDLGVMKLEKKGDAKGAVELWQKLLKTNPNLAADKRDQVEKMIAQAKLGKRQPVN
jgi:cytochrome c-type biogenesis protein CcmH/NrfG